MTSLAPEIEAAEQDVMNATTERARLEARRRLLKLLTVACVLRDGPTCVYCKKITLVYGPEHARRTVDHIVPTVSGGLDTLDNLCIACKGCNTSKGARPVQQFAPRFRHQESAQTLVSRPPAAREERA